MMKAKRQISNRLATWGTDLSIVSLLILCVMVLWALSHGKTSVESWNYPIQYGLQPNTVDTKWALASIKASMEGDLAPLMPRQLGSLGAPVGARWNDFMMPDLLPYWCAGILARYTGLFSAANIAVLGAQLLAAVGMYLGCRLLGANKAMAICAGVCFAFSSMAHARMLHHLTVLYYWHVPLCIAVCWLALNGKLSMKGRFFWLPLLLSIFTAIQNPYFTALYLQLLGLCGLSLVFKRQRMELIPCVVIIIVTLAVFVVFNIPTFWDRAVFGPNKIASFRVYQWLEMFALKPIDLFMPPPWHRIDWMAALGDAYRRSVFVPSELPPSNYLGVVGILALGLLIFDSFRAVSSRPMRPVPVEFFGVLYIIAFSVVGGLNSVLGVAGLQMLRSSNRFSIFILAIVLIYAARRLSAIPFVQQHGLFIAALIGIVGLTDQLPRAPKASETWAIRREVDADRDFVARLERALPPGSAVCQLPYCPFPEANLQMIPDYEHFTPYLFSTTLKYSFGDIKGRGRDTWLLEAQQKPLNEAVSIIKSKGFSSLLMYMPAFKEQGDSILAEVVRVTGGTRIDHSLGNWSAVVFPTNGAP